MGLFLFFVQPPVFVFTPPPLYPPCLNKTQASGHCSGLHTHSRRHTRTFSLTPTSTPPLSRSPAARPPARETVVPSLAARRRPPRPPGRRAGPARRPGGRTSGGGVRVLALVCLRLPPPIPTAKPATHLFVRPGRHAVRAAQPPLRGGGGRDDCAVCRPVDRSVRVLVGGPQLDEVGGVARRHGWLKWCARAGSRGESATPDANSVDGF